jgi:hypothetical protein
VSRIAWIAAGLIITAAFALADLTGAFVAPLEHPAIEYPTRAATGPIAELNQRIQNGEIGDGKIELKFEGPSGYLRSVLRALHIPVESQMLVFSKTSFQAFRINPSNPRSLFFNDTVSVGWVRGGDILEIAAEDPRQGVIFYLLDNHPAAKPQFRRSDECLGCHESYGTLGVPGMLVRSVYPDADGMPMFAAGTFVTDHRSPIEERFGGWYVTGASGSVRHLGNTVFTDPQNPRSLTARPLRNPLSLGDRFDTTGYLSPYSDIVALMTFEHQMRMVNLLTRVGWEIRYALYEEQRGTVGHDFTLRRLRETANEIVDYLLFVDEAPLDGKIQGSAGFAEVFAAAGPFDRRGRSLREFDLEKHLMRYPCSYMIYSPAFDALPAESKDSIGERLWQVLSGQVLSSQTESAKYARLSRADRQAVIEILRDTKNDLFRSHFR